VKIFDLNSGLSESCSILPQKSRVKPRPWIKKFFTNFTSESQPTYSNFMELSFYSHNRIFEKKMAEPGTTLQEHAHGKMIIKHGFQENAAFEDYHENQ
jgi:hypothetical protein